MPDRREQRIFWLGMHVVLTKTELPRLRALGYEVFNPPYNAPVYDQSANLDWDRDQPTTLPPEVFRELAGYNFFYNPISSRIARLLNDYFGTVLVTINPDWLKEVLAVYRGRIIYRTYGQPGTLSEHLWATGCGRAILERDDFTFVPFAPEVAESEQAWLKERMEVVPYTLPPDTFAHRDTWDIDEPHLPEIMVSCPNIANAYYAHHYRYLKLLFPLPFLRLYGVQPKPVDDPRVVGTIPRAELLGRYRRSAGYFYSYRVPNVCYLPPIEMMTVGGPVVFLSNSLLARYFPRDAPGLARDPLEARKLLNRLVRGDRPYIRELIASQREVRKRYDPDHVNPIFDEVFLRLLGGSAPAPKVSFDPERLPPSRKRVYLLFHFPGCLVQFQQGKYSAAEGIPRVMYKLAETILNRTDYDLVVTCRSVHFQEVFGFFRSLHQGDRLSFARIDDPATLARYMSLSQRTVSAVRNLMATGPAQPRVVQALSQMLRQHLPVRLGYRVARGVWRRLVRARGKLGRMLRLRQQRPAEPPYVRAINADPGACCVLIPHYYLFPEAPTLKVPSVLYLPDFLPHFVTESFEGNADCNIRVGQELVRRVSAVLTNSEFTRSYLPDCTLRVAPEKINVVPIPLLMPRRKPLDHERAAQMRRQIGDGPFLFYPTQNRPNKQIAFLLRLFALLRLERRDLKLVLTCRLEHVPDAAETFTELMLDQSVVFMQGITDEELSWLYAHTAALCLTTTMEGNFPPQVFEALAAGAPVVATRLPLITEILGDQSESLLLCEPLDEADFLRKLGHALDRPDEVRRRQRAAYERLIRHADDARFGEVTEALIRKVAA